MTRIVRINLGDAGREWVRSCLSRGGPLSKACLRSIDLNQGEVLALVPPEAPADVLKEPEWGGVVTSGEPEAELDALAGELVEQGATYVIADNDLSREGDPILADVRNVVPVGGGRVVFWARLPTPDPFHAHVFCGYPTVAFLSRARAGESHLDVIEAISRSETERVIALTVGAYDAETWIVWRRR